MKTTNILHLQDFEMERKEMSRLTAGTGTGGSGGGGGSEEEEGPYWWPEKEEDPNAMAMSFNG